jgi:hydroxymethylglutaryl-CoA lyase
MARPDLVPPLANTLEVIEQLNEAELERCWVWVATPGHVRLAAEAGARNMQYCLSVSVAHNLKNLGRTTEESMALLPGALEIASGSGAKLQLCLATSFSCPFEGGIDPKAVLALVNDKRTNGVSDVVICDTLGQATTEQVRSLVGRVAEIFEGGIVFHGHDTWGQGVANAFAAIESGASTIDGSLAGLGGCPFAPGAAGNTSTEDLAFGMQPAWLDHDGLRRLMRLGDDLSRRLDEINRSKAADAAAKSSAVFPWSLAAQADGARLE